MEHGPDLWQSLESLIDFGVCWGSLTVHSSGIELLIGDSEDCGSRELATKFSSDGCRVVSAQSVGDNRVHVAKYRLRRGKLRGSDSLVQCGFRRNGRLITSRYDPDSALNHVVSELKP